MARALLVLAALAGLAHAGEVGPADALPLALRGGPDAAAVRASVAATGVHLGEPVGTAACARCHPAVVAQWTPSAHRFASFANPYYVASVEAFRAERGFEASTFCGDCHDPLIVAGGKMLAPIDRGTVEAQAGLTCLVCHAIDAPDQAGNGAFQAHVSGPRPGPEHRAHVARPALRTPTLCASCHRVGLTEAVTADRWFRGQDEYGDWRDSGWSGRGAPSIWRPPEVRACVDCHMPRVPVGPEEKGAVAGRIRSHRFAAANAALARLAQDDAQAAAVAASLAGAVSVALQDGGDGRVDVVMRNRTVGHRFPGGTVDSNEVWVELTAWDARGKVLRRSGGLDAAGHLDPDAHRVRAQPVDDAGLPLARRDVQHQRGVVFDGRLPPGQPRAVRYRLPAGTARVKARLLYRKFSKDYVEFACAEVKEAEARARCLTPPILEVGAAEARVSGGRVPASTDWQALTDHALALAVGLEGHATQAWVVASEARRLAPPERPEPILAQAMAAARLGRTDDVVALLDVADALPTTPPASAWIRANALARAYRTPAALAAAERLGERLPDDRHTWTLLARLRAVMGDAAGALQAADRALLGDQEFAPALYQRLLALRALKAPGVEDAEAKWSRHRRATETDLALRQKWRAARGPGRPDPSEPLPEY